MGFVNIREKITFLEVGVCVCGVCVRACVRVCVCVCVCVSVSVVCLFFVPQELIKEKRERRIREREEREKERKSRK